MTAGMIISERYDDVMMMTMMIWNRVNERQLTDLGSLP